MRSEQQLANRCQALTHSSDHSQCTCFVHCGAIVELHATVSSHGRKRHMPIRTCSLLRHAHAMPPKSRCAIRASHAVASCRSVPTASMHTRARACQPNGAAHARRRPGAHGRAALGCARRQCRQRRLNPLRSAAAARWLSRRDRQGSGALCARRRQGPPTAQLRRVQKDRAQCSQRSRPYSPAPSHSSTQLMAWSCHSVQSAERIGRAGGVTTRARACAKISAPSSSRSRRLELISSCHCRTQYLSICRRHTCAPVGHLPPESERSSCDANQNEARICAHAATGATQTRSSLSIRHAKGWAPAWTAGRKGSLAAVHCSGTPRRYGWVGLATAGSSSGTLLAQYCRWNTPPRRRSHQRLLQTAHS